jgi:2,3-bisphosphoglycerate-independent phosphoglycerate mutase
MQELPIDRGPVADEFATLDQQWRDFDFFCLHGKKETDRAGEDGDFAGKVRVIEGADAQMPRPMAPNPDVVIVSGDHWSPE